MKTGFIGDLPAQDCAKFGGKVKRVRIAYYRNENGTVTVQPKTARGAASLSGAQTIAADQYAVRPFNTRDPLVETRWALGLCGWHLSAA